MATANPYLDGNQHYAATGHSSSTPQSGSRASKRKRDPNEHRSTNSPGMIGRGMPNPRRTSQHQHAPGDPNNAFDEQSMHNSNAAAQFDLSALQSHQPSNQVHHAQQHPSGPASMNSTAAAALSYTMTVPPHPAQEFIHQPTVGAENTNLAVSDFQNIGSPTSPAGHGANASTPPHSAHHDPNASGNSPPSDSARTPGGSILNNSNKPAVGTEGWNKMRKDNHKEVERRRRETINEGINELAKIVPGCEKNKGSILARAVQYIQKLQDDASSNIDKWTFEKLVTEQAIGDLSGKLDRAHAMVAALKREAGAAGVDVEAVEMGLGSEIESQQQQQQPSSSSGNTAGNGSNGASATSSASTMPHRTQASTSAQSRSIQPQPPRVGTANMGRQSPGQEQSGGLDEARDGKTA